jgi:hypothetical protein
VEWHCALPWRWEQLMAEAKMCMTEHGNFIQVVVLAVRLGSFVIHQTSTQWYAEATPG